MRKVWSDTCLEQCLRIPTTPHLRPGSLVLSFSISCCDICRGIGGDSVRIVAMAFIFCLCPPMYPMGLLHRQWNVIDCRRKSTRKLSICVAFLGLRPLCLMITWDNIHCLSASVIFNHLDLNKGHLLGQHIWRMTSIFDAWKSADSSPLHLIFLCSSLIKTWL